MLENLLFPDKGKRGLIELPIPGKKIIGIYGLNSSIVDTTNLSFTILPNVDENVAYYIIQLRAMWLTPAGSATYGRIELRDYLDVIANIYTTERWSVDGGNLSAGMDINNLIVRAATFIKNSATLPVNIYFNAYKLILENS